MVQYPTLAPPAQTEFLAGLVDRTRALRAAGKVPVVVFDLDGTLLDNRPRTVAILAELAAVWGEKHPREADLIRDVPPSSLLYLFTDTLRKLGVKDEALEAEALAFWRARFFRDAHLAHDVEVPGAAAFAKRIYEAGAQVVYLTGRDLPFMSLGSWASLRDLSFPIGVIGTELVCKPDPAIPDEDYKRMIAPTITRHGELVASFDNEPGNCNAFLEAHPEAASVLLDTQHLPGAPALLPGVVSLRDFRQA